MSSETPKSQNPGRSSPDSDRETAPLMQDGDQAADQEGQPSGNQPDVLLDVPVVKVDEIHLEVDDLKAQVSVQGELADLVKLNAGFDIRLSNVKLDIKGVEAQAQVKARLENVRSIFEQVLTTLDENPQVLEGLTEKGGRGSRGVDQTLGRAARSADLAEDAAKDLARADDEDD